MLLIKLKISKICKIVLLLVLQILVLDKTIFIKASANSIAIASVSPGKYSYYLDCSNETIARLEYPKSMVLTEAIGDLLFKINLIHNGFYSSISIYIPPEFEGLIAGDTSNIWTSYTNDYRFISVSKMNELDPIAPNWWRISIANVTSNGIPKGEHSIRIFKLKAPKIIGRYFFKIFVNGTSIGAKNFPTLVISGSLNPAYISGTIRYGGFNRSLFGNPIKLPEGTGGRVIAIGKTPQGKIVKARAYFNSSMNGAYTLYGLPAGTYNLTAEAAGFAPIKLENPVSVLEGQSLENVDFYLKPSPIIGGTIWSRCKQHEVPWGNASYSIAPNIVLLKSKNIYLELLDFNLKPITIFKNTTVPSLSYHRFLFNGSIEYDGHIPQDKAGYISGLKPGDYYIRAHINGYNQLNEVVVHLGNYSTNSFINFFLEKSSRIDVVVNFKEKRSAFENSPSPRDHVLVLEAYDLTGTLKARNFTFVNAGNEQALISLTGFRDLYETLKIYDSGLLPGTYLIKAYMGEYLQEGTIEVTVAGCNNAVEVSLGMFKASILNITFTSIEWQNPPRITPWAFPGKNITVRFFDIVGNDYGVINIQQPNSNIVALEYWGIDYYRITKSFFPYYFSLLHDKSLPSGTYLIKVNTLGYIQKEDFLIEGLEGSISDRNLKLIKGATIEVTILFKKEKIFTPISLEKNVPIRIELFDISGNFVGANISYIPVMSKDFTILIYGFESYAGNPAKRWVNFYDTTDGVMQLDYGLPSGNYRIKVLVPGYEQKVEIFIEVNISSKTSIMLELDKLAYISGWIGGFNCLNELMNLSWASFLAFSNESYVETVTLDGFYELWLESGNYSITVAMPGYLTESKSISASDASVTEINIILKAYDNPIEIFEFYDLFYLFPLIIFTLLCFNFLLNKKLKGKA
ncbi:MAG: carboxypeptidase regulatory-like domain-containing protein [Candidatus Bathyarchaeia archaeon]